MHQVEEFELMLSISVMELAKMNIDAKHNKSINKQTNAKV
jgi:hypothetical protein